MGQFEDFAPVAERFCALVETSDTLNRGEFVNQLERHLVALYGAALELTNGDPNGPDPSDSMSSEQWKALHLRLSRKFGDFDLYALIFDPYEGETSPVTASLADDVADIYRDLKTGLLYAAAGGSKETAVWDWKFSFDTHWGRHAAHALAAVNSIGR